ncbi:Acetyltransferase (GNAT) domain-containing protein [Nitrosomonas eutropha]|uniref:Acetyltransferase (GNAT) domain-containing protein n=1 Tax=Nitrosomonas eutropha TaxID=916 RepID=A0A1I7GT99_9PROT|nr:GNAT family N-acetyltransferase [Nitrosomonas eutropha]SFU51678.1 Acetyltransferase (GNAT) domain-containing protein [Nitrosomonas eutropha]
MEKWFRQSINFTVRLGEIRLLTWPLSACVLKTHFTELPAHPVAPAELSEFFRNSIDVVVTRSHPIESSLSRLNILPHAIRYIPSSYQRYWVVLDSGFENYLKKFSAKSRNTLLRKIKKFAEFSGGEIDWREYRKPEEMHAFHKLAMEVSLKTYQERLLDCGLPSDQQFQENMLELTAKDNVRGYILFYLEKPIAYIYCPVHDGIALYEYVGHDPEYQRWSPGTLLQYYALQCLFAADHVKIFDFTEGEGAHKAFFATNAQYCADIYYFRRTWRNLIKVALHTGSDGLSRGIVQVLEKLKLKAYIKKILRSTA